jgi:hypothetical protein
VHSEIGSNKAFTWIFDSAAAGTGGDVSQARPTSRSPAGTSSSA